MPVVEQATMQDINPKQRPKLRKLLDKRAVLNYSFDYSLLMTLLENLGVEDKDSAKELICNCVIAMDESSLKAEKSKLDEEIREILTENEILGIREPDPAGRKMDCLLQHNDGIPRIDKNLLVEKAPGLGISAKKVTELIDAATVKKPFDCVVMREVKGK